MRPPSCVKREPWQGQSHECSCAFHFSAQPMCGQRGAVGVSRLAAASSAFSYVMNYLKVPQNMTIWLLSLTSNETILTLLLLLMMLVLGCFMDMGILILVTTPILYPIAVNGLGFNPYHFGVVLVLAYGIGLCTPPVGTSLFIGCTIAKQPVEKMIKGFLPFYLVMVILLLLLTFVPEITLCLPRMLGLIA